MNSLKIIMDSIQTYAKSFSASPERKRLCFAEIWRLHFKAYMIGCYLVNESVSSPYVSETQICKSSLVVDLQAVNYQGVFLWG